MTCSRLTLGALALALLVPLTSCGLLRDAEETAQTQAESAEPAAEPSPEPGSAEDALPYVEALGRSSDPELVEEGLEFAHPDWPAHGYLQHQANGVRANLVSGHRLQDDPVELTDQGIRLCRTSGCATFGGFVFVEGLLADFRVEGDLVGDHLLPGGGGDTVEGVTVTVASSYHAIRADCLIVFADVETESVEVSVLDATHEAPDGELGPLDPRYGVTGQDHFTPASPGQVMLWFESTDGGGTVDLVLECVEGCEGEVHLSLPLE
ncbi:hypothetical protein GCM10007079_25660 [Nocardiopsis terrae]|uniref:Lipoprotein n=1 Tax=Nocardiopsis terrae TaxID=372655 RepID=A0ABR9HFQ1_9ACTN|nr:hypothetical protein [Nocardiopsis terrae]MBE1457829.1 hypothetical protein [Nocardiopsis terrae]GHC84055.1 hypothetical protein GCM10007079_25660 [Nocardiopsis terrae]